MSTICVIKSRKYPLGEKDIVDGGTLNAHTIVSELRCNGYDIEVFTRNEGNEQEVVNQHGLRIFRVPFTRSANSNVLIRDYEEGKSFVEGVISHSEFKPEKYTCIHTHHWTSGVGLEFHIPAQIKLIHTPHLLASEKAHHNKLLFPSYIKEAEQALLDRANHIIVLSKSEEAAVYTTYGCDKQKITLAPNGLSATFFELPALDEESLQSRPILFIGRRCRQKGIDILLDATELIVESGLPISVRLVGGQYGEPEVDKIFEERIQKAPFVGIVEQTGEVTYDRIPALLNDSFVYTQPSRYESQGVALLEAMAAGRVVVASDLPAISEYIRHGENGFLVEPENSCALADTLQKILTNPKEVLPVACAARETAREYTWQRMLKTVLPLFGIK
jgi:glycosyltransferase involved in cell wall biosynthesis